ncbi:hypothetical protein M2D07_028155 [Pseudomonas sp. BGr12]|uniref:hypothetical protein n=1 Tax=Pseudomonas sp. BGr12 TaxID=2936269 RepID=UPI002559DA31|nr:hypothetical protein [Pseudomonas sp. BJa5]MDL2430922.1 hypothetical protein [Pseudomonas sp. BJa5]
MEIDFYPGIILIKGSSHNCSRDISKKTIYIPFTQTIDVKIGDIVEVKSGESRIQLRVLDLCTYDSQYISTDHANILELHVDNLTATKYLPPGATQMINIGNLTGQQVQVGNNNSQVVNITLEQLTREIAKSDDAEAKGVLRKMLENPTVSSVIGAGVSGLIGLL